MAHNGHWVDLVLRRGATPGTFNVILGETGEVLVTGSGNPEYAVATVLFDERGVTGLARTRHDGAAHPWALKFDIETFAKHHHRRQRRKGKE